MIDNVALQQRKSIHSHTWSFKESFYYEVVWGFAVCSRVRRFCLSFVMFPLNKSPQDPPFSYLSGDVGEALERRGRQGRPVPSKRDLCREWLQRRLRSHGDTLSRAASAQVGKSFRPPELHEQKPYYSTKAATRDAARDPAPTRRAEGGIRLSKGAESEAGAEGHRRASRAPGRAPSAGGWRGRCFRARRLTPGASAGAPSTCSPPSHSS